MDNYYEEFINFWLPIYKKQLFHIRLSQDIVALSELIFNIKKNMIFTKEEKLALFKELGISEKEYRKV